MEQTIPTTNNATGVTYMQALHFIHQYRAFEKLPLEEGQRLIRHLCTSSVEHVCDHWRWKKRGFGAFYFEMDIDFRISLLQHFGINSPELEAHKKMHQDKSFESLKKRLFAPKPQLLQELEDLLMFFENHGMCTRCAEDIVLVTLPKSKKQFGNSSNWADYILSLAPDTKRGLVTDIIAHYAKRRVAA